MALQTVEDIIRALQEHPEWREPLLQVLLPERYQQLPERTDRLEQALARMAEESARTEQRIQQFAQHTEQRFQQIADALHTLSENVRLLVEQMERWEVEMGSVKGITLQLFYRENATAILGRHFRRPKLLDKGDYLQQVQDLHPLSESEWQQLVSADLLTRGVHRQTGEEYVMAWEVSWMVDRSDVERAVRRAEILRRWEPKALPVVAGKGITAGAQEAAQASGVLVILDTQIIAAGSSGG
ncbi:MAG: hypothetical protein RMM06_03850 [Armatimonadota bacterium]|nr:hypothetical protein [Armatimonadota bacterium]MDW8104954.1 hypothetical protein [Armatimonadota bacterium]MDW8289829.1 hypothetical protein [Armatimonadota bacterium]